MENSSATTDRVYFDALPTPQESESWWSRYASALTNLTPTARAVLETDSRYIVNRGVFGVGAPNPDSWPESRVRTGLVMGSVQSGKTASMLGVIALALDQGVDLVVVLAGTRLSLWRQTYERLTEQLDAGPDSARRVGRRMLCPRPGVALSEGSSSLQDTYRLPPAQVRRMLHTKGPIIVVAMKQANHLHALSAVLRRDVFDLVRGLPRPVHMLVLDDEADDGSILDAVVEASQDPVFGNLKQIPRAIANLWDPAIPAPENLFATYVGYTATPQANLLQEDHNPLAPRHFVVSLRTPLDLGYPVDPQVLPGQNRPLRSSTYPEPAGLKNYYTGGEVYYRRGRDAGLCVETTGKPDEDLAEAIRAFLVAGAIRLHQSGRLGPHSATKADFDTAEDATAAASAPHSMLLHPSANIDDQFKAAEDVLLWAGISDRATARAMLESGNSYLPESLIGHLEADEGKWSAWVEHYRDSAKAIHAEFNTLKSYPVPDWNVIKPLLVDEVISGTRVAVVNSDPSADDRPLYKPAFEESSSRWRAARDLSTIFVSGNVMARGLTLEGMTTALFLRESSNPLADTQMQMQRWFGYRGAHIELCRLFASESQLSLFSAYHDIDEAVRAAIAEAMAGDAPTPVVLQGLGFLATGKIANLGNKPLCLGPKPFVKLINEGSVPDPNARLVANLFASGPSVDLVSGGIKRGRILERPLSLADAADILDHLIFAAYQPGSDTQLGQFWSQVQARVSAIQSLSGGANLYRPPIPQSGMPSSVRRDCPYTIPAYLRLWEACLTRSVRGLFVTGAPADLWSMANLHVKRLQQPKFWVGIRYGAGPRIRQGPLAELPFPIPATSKALRVENGDIATDWGSHDPTAGPHDYRGDEFFDYYHRNEPVCTPVSASPWRPAGSDGQILFYVNQPNGQRHPAVAVGVCIPAGGPEQFAATRARTLATT